MVTFPAGACSWRSPPARRARARARAAERRAVRAHAVEDRRRHAAARGRPQGRLRHGPRLGRRAAGDHRGRSATARAASASTSTPALVKLANENAAKAGVADRVKFEQARPLRDRHPRGDRPDALPPAAHRDPARAADLRRDAARLARRLARLSARAVAARQGISSSTCPRRSRSAAPRAPCSISTSSRRASAAHGGSSSRPRWRSSRRGSRSSSIRPGTKGSATIGNRQVALEGVKIAGESVRFAIPGSLRAASRSCSKASPGAMRSRER